MSMHHYVKQSGHNGVELHEFVMNVLVLKQGGGCSCHVKFADVPLRYICAHLPVPYGNQYDYALQSP
eukprot:scaffold459231_cov40-Prasinocladus_malaysianus.AAC.1